MKSSLYAPNADLPSPHIILSFREQNQKRPPDLDAVLFVLGNMNRRIIFELLCRRERTIEELIIITSVKYQGIRKNLRILEAYGLITSFKEGKFRYYHANANALFGLALWVRTLKKVVARLN